MKACVIGSGIAGLASAVRLTSKGYEVTVFEANSYPGGKLHAFNRSGYKFDYGPSLFTMPHYVEELFELHGIDPGEHFSYKRKENICNYFWDDGTRFSANARLEEFIEEASETFQEPKETLKNYLNNSEAKYKLTENLFLSKSLHKLSTYLNQDTITGILNIGKLDLNKSLNQVHERYFGNPKLIQLFNRYATYNGSNPYITPGIMSLIPQLEMKYGTYYPLGGMHEISQSIYRLACLKGVQFHFNEKVKSILSKDHRAYGVKTEKGEYLADVVVCNMDVFAAYQSILKESKAPKRILKQERSSSALIFYWGIKQTFPELDLHNIFFSNDYRREFEAIFSKSEIINDPTVYINITSKEEPQHAPPGCENWFVMINTPGNKGQDWERLKSNAKQFVIKKLSNVLKTNIEPLIEVEEILDPVSIERDTLSHQGSLYGTSSNSKFAAFLRHPNFSQAIKNLYFCGGSAHPGGGIPLCLLSAKIVSDLVSDVKTKG